MSDRREAMSELAKVEHRCLDLLNAGRPLPEILEEITGGVDEILSGIRSSILLVEDGVLRPGAAPRLDPEFIEITDGVPVDEGNGSCGTAAYRAEQVIVTDTETDPLWADYRDVVEQFQLRSCWSVPVVDFEGQVLATFALYSPECRHPRAVELDLIDRIARFVQLAIERSRVIERIKTNERRFQMVTDHLEDVFWITDESKETMHFVSPAYAEIWGRSCRELYENPRQWLEWIHPEDRSRVKNATRQQNKGEYLEEYRIIRPDGEIRWIRDRGFPVHDDEQVWRIVGIASDITDRKKAELRLRERLKELRCLYDISSCLVEGTGRELDELCRDIVELISAGLQFDEVAVASLRVGDLEVRSTDWQKPTDSIRIAIDVDGVEHGYLEAGYVEERRDSRDGPGPFSSKEKEMLETVAAQVGQTLERRHMAQKLAQNERLNAIGQLTGGVAHDFNNLLTIIVSNASMLTRDDDSPPQTKEMAEDILEAGKRGAKLTDRLMAFARRQPLKKAIIDVNELIETMGELWQRTLGEHIEVEYGLQTELWKASVDAGQLESALLNLCLNARDAMPDGGRLTIRTRNHRVDDEQGQRFDELEAGDYICIAVEDNGIGMDETTRRRAFEPFFTTREVGEGSGLGLSMVFGFVRQSNGEIDIESTPKKGTTVRLWLPAADVVCDDTEMVCDSTDTADNNATPDGQGQRVLLVEDDDLVRRNALRQLRHMGYDVEAVESGPQAMEALRRRDDIDVLFTDVVMPGGMDGYELARRARKFHPDLSVLFTSGYSEEFAAEDDDSEGDPSSSGPMLTKPYEQAELAQALAEAVE